MTTNKPTLQEAVEVLVAQTIGDMGLDDDTPATTTITVTYTTTGGEVVSGLITRVADHSPRLHCCPLR